MLNKLSFKIVTLREKLYLSVLIILLIVPVYILWILFYDFISSNILNNIDLWLLINWRTLPYVIIFTVAVLLIQHIFSKTKSISKLFNRCLAFIFWEVILFVWFNVWRSNQIYIEMGYTDPVVDRLESMFDYIKAIFKTLALSLVYLGLKRIWKRKNNA